MKKFMKKLIASVVLLFSCTAAFAQGVVSGPSSATGSISPFSSPAGVNSTLTLTSSTTAYTAGQLIANNATAGSIVVPFFTIPMGYKTAAITRIRLSTNDSTSTAWGAASITVDFWSAAPTFTNGDRAAFSPATGTALHLAAFTCTMSSEYGDGAYAECPITQGNFSVSGVTLGNIYWSLTATNGSGVTGASKVFTMTPEFFF